MPYTFRPAVESDIQAITDIYNASVMAGGATADLTPRTLDQRRAWVESHTPPYGVFVVESEDGSIIGFGALSVFYDRAGYDGVIRFGLLHRSGMARQGSRHVHA